VLAFLLSVLIRLRFKRKQGTAFLILPQTMNKKRQLPQENDELRDFNAQEYPMYQAGEEEINQRVVCVESLPMGFYYLHLNTTHTEKMGYHINANQELKAGIVTEMEARAIPPKTAIIKSLADRTVKARKTSVYTNEPIKKEL
jgi:hypothetical protein